MAEARIRDLVDAARDAAASEAFLRGDDGWCEYCPVDGGPCIVCDAARYWDAGGEA